MSRRVKKRDEYEPGPEPEQVSFRSYKKTAIGFLFLVFILLTVIAYVSLAKATVTVVARATDVSAELNAEVRGLPTPTEVKGEVKTIVLEGERTEVISGEIKEMPSAATGTVRLINEQSRSQQLVATTRLLSPENKLFRLKKTVTLPAKGTLVSEVYADAPGVDGEIAPSRFTIPGLSGDLQKKIYAISDEPMRGGVRSLTGVSENDVKRALEELGKSMLPSGEEELKKLWNQDLGGAAIYDWQILEHEVNPPIGSDTQNFTVRAKIKIFGVHYDKEGLFTLIEEKLKEKVRSDEDLRNVDRDGFVVEIVRLDSDSGIATLKGTLKGKITIADDNKILDPEQLVGLTKGSAEEYLRGFHAVEEAEVKIRPFWLRRLPNLRDRIIIKVITK